MQDRRGFQHKRRSGCCVAAALLSVAICRSPLPAQTSTSSPVPAYDVAAIKPAKSGDMQTLLFRSGRMSAKGMTLRNLIKQAYGVQDDQILEAPKWVSSQTYDIEAKVDNADPEVLNKLGPDDTKAMLQAFLKDRFQLKAHWETRELPILALVVAKGGAKLEPAKPGDTYPDGIKGPDGKAAGHAGIMRWGRGQLIGQGIPIASLVSPLTQQLGHIVQDQTGLTGTYDIALHWTDDIAPDSQGAADSSGPSIFTAIQEQLGLKLQSQKAQVPVLVIDHAAPPTEN